MFKIIKLPFLCFTYMVLQGCATMEYYEFLEPQRSANQQFIDTPYVYSGLVETGAQANTYQFSGVLHDNDDKYLDIIVPANIAVKEHPMVSSVLDAKLRHNLVELKNTDQEKTLGEPALLVVNPNYPFNLDMIKNKPRDFAEKYYLGYQSQSDFQPKSQSDCPHIILLNIDVYEEFPTTIDIAMCQSRAIKDGYVWQTINAEKISNLVEHDKVFGYQIGYLGFLITVPFDAIVSPFYTLGWGLVASKNLLFSGDE